MSCYTRFLVAWILINYNYYLGFIGILLEKIILGFKFDLLNIFGILFIGMI